jgi:hypothetical protein
MPKYNGKDLTKGKFIKISRISIKSGIKLFPIKRWAAPAVGWYKLNTDGPLATNGEAGASMIARDHQGEIIFSACRQFFL